MLKFGMASSEPALLTQRRALPDRCARCNAHGRVEQLVQDPVVCVLLALAPVACKILLDVFARVPTRCGLRSGLTLPLLLHLLFRSKAPFCAGF